MADPLSVAGLALSVASLTFELFSGCVKGYNLLLEAKDMPTTCRHLLVRLQMERDKLIGWAVLANVSESDDSLPTTLKLSRHTIHDVFREMQVLLLDVAKLNERYNLQLVAADEDGDDLADVPDAGAARTLPEQYAALEKRAVRLFNKTRKCPKRLRWAAFDKDKFEELLSAVAVLNDNMMHFLNSFERQRHYRMQEVTFMQILEVNNRMDELLELLKSLKTASPGPRTERNSLDGDESHRQEYEQRTIKLARFKAVNLAVERGGPGTDSDGPPTQDLELEIPLDDLDLADSAEPTSPGQKQRSHGFFAGQPVWVEWRHYQPVFDDDDDDDDDEAGRPPAAVASRICKMAKLQCDPEKPAEFHVPDCLGYVQDPRGFRLGFVYKMDPSAGAPPVSLLQRLGTVRKPSLTVRVRIACLVSAAIWYLHSTQWLHKGLRSDNIVFQRADDGPLAAPVLCGFDYSRPADVDETTERPTQDPWHDLYRHPRTQFNVPREGKNGFRKLYDIYSLGVVLFEVGTWKPVHELLGIGAEQPKAAAVKGVQGRLLSQEMLELLEAEAGGAYASAVRFCLGNGAETAGLEKDEAAVQLAVWEQLVMRLEQIRV